MRVLHVFDHSLPVHSGYSIRSLNIVLHQRQLGWTTAQLTGPKQGSAHDDTEIVNGLEFVRTSAERPRWARRMPLDPAWTIYRIRRRARSIVAEFDPDVIHAHSPSLNGLAVLGLGKPVVYEMRTLWEEGSALAGRMAPGGLAYRAARYLESFVLKRANAVIVISEGLRGLLVSRGISKDRITIVPNAVNVDRLAPSGGLDREAARTRFALAGRYVLGYVGSLFAWEGLELLIEALAQARKHVPDLALLIVGSGPEESALRKSVQHHGLKDHVVFAGQLPHETVLDAYAAIDLLVYPRLPMPLTELVTPLKPLEAMAIGRVCVASDVGGHRELISHRETGLLFRAGDAGALSAAIIEAVHDPSLCRAISDNGPRAVRAARTWSQSVARYAESYERAIDAASVRK